MTIPFFFNDTATTEIYTLSLHDALPIYLDAYLSATQLGITLASLALGWIGEQFLVNILEPFFALARIHSHADRKSTRLNSSHSQISYAVFCLKKKNSLSDFSSSSTERQS